MSYARYRVFAAGTGFAHVKDMGPSWGGSVTGVEFANGDTPLRANEQGRYDRDWTPPSVPYWDGSLREATMGEIATRTAEVDAAEAERLNTPIVYDRPLETPSLVLQSHEGLLGVGVVATDEGDLVTYTYHASPIPSAAEIKARKDAAITAHKAAKQEAKDVLDALKVDVGALKEKSKP